MARPKKATNELGNLEDCNAAMYRLLLSTLNREKLVAARDLQVAAAQKLFEHDIDADTGNIADLTAQLQQYYVTHIDACEQDGRKSVQLTYGVMGTRLSPPALKLLNKSWTWAAVLAKLREVMGDRFLRQRDPEVDKDAVKQEIPEERLKDYGLKLAREETFYAEPQRPPAEGVAK
jgi:phage host-nuclease inhibitor protein Gam